MNDEAVKVPRSIGQTGRILGWLIGAALLAVWIGVVATFAISPDQKTRAIALGVGLFATELAFWGAALLLGLRVAQARALIWQKLKGTLRMGRRSPGPDLS